MATESNNSLPKIMVKNYWAIRKKLKATIPSRLTSSFVAAALGIKEVSAQTNVISPFKQLDLINDQGVPTDLLFDWRDDDKYEATCKKIRENVNPEELLHLATDAESDKDTIISWIAGKFRVGNEAARQAAAVYLLLLEADLSKQPDTIKVQKTANSATKTKKSSENRSKPETDEEESVQKKSKKERGATGFEPILNLNIQIHISADSSPEQIETIFASMSKHLGSVAKQ
ncbi:MAG: DUF5343 domain-containing protein [Sneathiella sp.]|nr:DUF5343 domain-containing protein [Sneathiella sp.]